MFFIEFCLSFTDSVIEKSLCYDLKDLSQLDVIKIETLDFYVYSAKLSTNKALFDLHSVFATSTSITKDI